MPISTTVQLIGLQNVLEALRTVPTVAKKHLAEAVQDTERVLASRIALAAPFDQGALRESIVAHPNKGLTGFVGIKTGMIRGRRPEVYWRFVEFGAIHRPAQPFVRPTADAESNAFLDRIRKAGQALERDLSVGRFG